MFAYGAVVVDDNFRLRVACALCERISLTNAVEDMRQQS